MRMLINRNLMATLVAVALWTAAAGCDDTPQPPPDEGPPATQPAPESLQTPPK